MAFTGSGQSLFSCAVISYTLMSPPIPSRKDLYLKAKVQSPSPGTLQI